MTIRLTADTGASLSATAHKHDFIELDESDAPTVLKGIAKGLSIHGEGVVSYIVQDDLGENINLLCKAYE